MKQAQTTNETIFKSQLLADTADMIKAAGYKVYWSLWRHDTSKPSYFHFTDGIRIGYCQQGYFGGIMFSTCHKPSTEAGTGFGLQDDPGVYEPTIKDAEKAFMDCPQWFRHKKFTPIKYANWEEYAAKNNSAEYVEY